jgi:hypothetical protein
MTNYPEILKSLALRSLIALPFVLLGLTGELSFASVLSPMLLVAGAIIVAGPLARLIAEPAGCLFYPGEHASQPAPMYSIPESKRASGLYEEAISGFEQIAQDYPQEKKPYIEMIEIAICNLKDPKRANEIYRQGIAVLETDEDKESLAKMYSAIRTRLNTKPSN